MVSMASSRIFTGLIAAALLFGLAIPLHAKEFIKGERPQQRGYSQAVITEDCLLYTSPSPRDS